MNNCKINLNKVVIPARFKRESSAVDSMSQLAYIKVTGFPIEAFGNDNPLKIPR